MVSKSRTRYSDKYGLLTVLAVAAHTDSPKVDGLVDGVSCKKGSRRSDVDRTRPMTKNADASDSVVGAELMSSYVA